MISTDLLKHAEQIAIELFKEVVDRNLIVEGKTEKELNDEIFTLAKTKFGIQKYWHKRIVRAGKNTLHPYRENPPNRTIQSDDILFFDFGPIIDHWQADLGRTYVLGSDPMKLKLAHDIEKAWHETHRWFHEQRQVTASEIYYFAIQKAVEYGWTFGGEMTGHLIGEFPHTQLDRSKLHQYLHPDNHNLMSALDENDKELHWILEMHFIDPTNQIGAFYEQLLK